MGLILLRLRLAADSEPGQGKRMLKLEDRDSM